MGKIRSAIIQERLYLWLLIFIISVNTAFFLTKKPVPPEKRQGEIKSFLHQKGFSREDLAGLLGKNKKLGVILSFFSFSVFFVIALGLFLDFIILVLKKEGGVLIYPAVFHKPPGWGIRDVFKIAILFLWFGYILVFIELFLIKVFPALKDENLRSLLNVTITDALAFLFIIYFVVYKYKENLVSLGLSAKDFFKNVFCGIAGYIATVPVLILALFFIIWISGLFKYEPPMQPVLEIFLEAKTATLIIYLTVLVAVFGPIAEEIFFRGFMYRAIKDRWGFKAALFSSSALFALLHANLAGFLPIMILGMLLAYLFEKTGTIVASCAVHILHNSVMVTFIFIMKVILKGAG